VHQNEGTLAHLSDSAIVVYLEYILCFLSVLATNRCDGVHIFVVFLSIHFRLAVFVFDNLDRLLELCVEFLLLGIVERDNSKELVVGDKALIFWAIRHRGRMRQP